MNQRIVLIGTLALLTPAAIIAQDSAQKPDVSDLQKQMQEMRSQMDKMQSRIDELEAKASARTSPSAQPAASENPSAPVESWQSLNSRMEKLEEPMALHYKGLTLTPGGFLEATALVRTRNENADIANSYSNIPLNGSSNSRLSEFRGSVRNSELSLLMQASPNSSTKLTAYVETDFLGAAPTANYVQSSSWTPRLRQLWMQIEKPSGWTIAGGQMWSLLTTNQHGIAPLAELRPSVADGQYVVGFTWTRERAARVTKNFHNGIWAAFAIEDPETTYSAAFVPSNIMGLNTSQNASTGVNLLPFLANYSNGQSTALAPDILAKVAFEPGWGHFEIKALGRFFRDRIASTATTTGHSNTTEGYGFGFAANMPVVKSKIDVSLEGLLGQGIGRYGSSALPDVTLNPNTGELRPLREARILGGIHYHPNKRLDLYTYLGDEYAGRYAFVSPSGGAAGYGSPLVSYAACTNEVALNTCSGANRNIYEVTVGYWYRFQRGEFGRGEYGNQVVYMHRNLWSGVGQTPQGGDLVVYSTLRFYLP